MRRDDTHVKVVCQPESIHTDVSIRIGLFKVKTGIVLSNVIFADPMAEFRIGVLLKKRWAMGSHKPLVSCKEAGDRKARIHYPVQAATTRSKASSTASAKPGSLMCAETSLTGQDEPSVSWSPFRNAPGPFGL